MHRLLEHSYISLSGQAITLPFFFFFEEKRERAKKAAPCAGIRLRSRLERWLCKRTKSPCSADHDLLRSSAKDVYCPGALDMESSSSPPPPPPPRVNGAQRALPDEPHQTHAFAGTIAAQARTPQRSVQTRGSLSLSPLALRFTKLQPERNSPLRRTGTKSAARRRSRLHAAGAKESPTVCLRSL